MPLRGAIEYLQPSFLALTETKTSSNKIPRIVGYDIFTLNPFAPGNSGGLAIYYKKALCHKVSIAFASMENSLVWIRLDKAEDKTKPIHIAIVYAPTATPWSNQQSTKISSFYEELNTTISLFRSHGHVILV